MKVLKTNPKMNIISLNFKTLLFKNFSQIKNFINSSTKSFKELVRQFNQEPTLNTSNTKLNTSQNANTNAEDVDLCFLVNSKDNIRYAVEGIQLYIDNVIEILRKASPNFNIRTAFISYNNDDW